MEYNPYTNLELFISPYKNGVKQNHPTKKNWLVDVPKTNCEIFQQGKLFGSSNPFDWMELISLQGKTNFFEKRVTRTGGPGTCQVGDGTYGHVLLGVFCCWLYK